MVTVWLTVSVPAEPLPPSQSFHEPVRAGRPVLLVIGPAVPVPVVAPDSKPGLPRMLSPVGGGGVVPPQVGSPVWAGTLLASPAACVELKRPQVEARFFAAVRVQVRYFR